MRDSRKRLIAEYNGIKRIEELYEYRKSIFVENSSEAEYAEMLTYIEATVAKLKRRVNKAPTGHQYTGTFYVRKINVDTTVEFIEMTGTAFMREDIISWSIDSEHEYAQNLYYVRDIFKDDKCREPIKREECKPVIEAYTRF